jgi:hypothetical protein
MYHTIKISRGAKNTGPTGPDTDCSYIGDICRILKESGMGIDSVSIGDIGAEISFRGPCEKVPIIQLFATGRTKSYLLNKQRS